MSDTNDNNGNGIGSGDEIGIGVMTDPSGMRQEDVISGGARSSHLSGMDSKYLSDKAIMAIQISLWSGTQTIGDAELQSLGIRDVKEFRKDHTPGSKFLVDKKKLSDISRVKSHTWDRITSMSSGFFTQNLRLVREEFVDRIVEVINEGERQLKEAVDEFLANSYYLEREAFYERTKRSSPSLTREEILFRYPVKDEIRRRHRVSFAILRTPRNNAISREVDAYCRRKMDEEVRAVIEETSESVRTMLAGVITNFQKLVSDKSPDARINQRTVRRLSNALDQFLVMAPTFGDTRISSAVAECQSKLMKMEGWSKSDLEGSDLPDAINSVFLATMDEKLIQDERSVFISNFISDLPVDPDSEEQGSLVELDPPSGMGDVFVGETPSGDVDY